MLDSVIVSAPAVAKTAKICSGGTASTQSAPNTQGTTPGATAASAPKPSRQPKVASRQARRRPI